MYYQNPPEDVDLLGSGKFTDDGKENYNSVASWGKVSQPKDRGWLGVINLKVQNKGLLLKFQHKF